MKERKHNKLNHRHYCYLTFIHFLVLFIWMMTAIFTYIFTSTICDALAKYYKFNYSNCVLYPLLFEPGNWFCFITLIPVLLLIWHIFFKLESRIINSLKHLSFSLSFWVIYVFIIQSVIMEPSIYLEEVHACQPPIHSSNSVSEQDNDACSEWTQCINSLRNKTK